MEDMNSKLNFEGFDWTELANYFGIYKNTLKNEDDILEKTKEYLSSTLYNSGEENKVADVIRVFLRALYNRCYNKKYTAPLWQGLLDISDNYTLIKYTCILLEHMWY